MQQITALNHIARCYQLHVSRCMITFFLFHLLMIDSCCARGPHHPRGGVKRRVEQQKHINEHLAFDSQHIQEDVNAQQLPTEKKVEEMTEDERNYLYFKVHDLDGNGKLDGLEIFYSATHHSATEHDHSHDMHNDENKIEETEEKPENDKKTQLSNDNSSNSDGTNLNLLELDENGQIIDKNINHIIDVLDNFLSLADLNNDGYLNYAEYAAAVKLGNAMVEEQHPEL